MRDLAGGRTKLVATIGPASVDRIPELLAAGMDVARINLSHGTDDDHALAIGRVREADPTVAVLVDLPGPKIRLGDLVEPVVELTSRRRLRPAPRRRVARQRVRRARRLSRPR